MERLGDKRTRSGEDESIIRKRQEHEKLAAHRQALLARELELRDQLLALTSEMHSDGQKIQDIELECRKTEREAKIRSVNDRISKLFSGQVDLECGCGGGNSTSCHCECQRNSRLDRAYRNIFKEEIEVDGDDLLLQLNAGDKMEAMFQIYNDARKVDEWLTNLITTEWVRFLCFFVPLHLPVASDFRL